MHKTEAELVSISDDGRSVTLLKADGKVVEIFLEKLSETDQSHVQKQQKINKAGLLPQNDRMAIDHILKTFRDKHSLAGGLSLVISYRERLVYAGAVGYADKQLKTPLTPKHRMRIASISKSITSIAIMKLMEERKLNLDEEVFGESGIFRGGFGVPTYENRPIEITVRQLLEHSAGGWSNSGPVDPLAAVFKKAVGKELMQTIIREYPLENLPGTKYDYSNFGYWVLGRVIEKKTRMTYEDYVKKHVLTPCGITGMRIGGKVPGPGEVEYFGENPSYFPISPMSQDANGGWVASPIELLKLLARIDGFSKVTDILKQKTIKTMTTPSAQNKDYALGWFVSEDNKWWHTGGLPGTRTLMVRRPEGINYVILMNGTPSIAADAERFQLILSIKKIIRRWPHGTKL